MALSPRTPPTLRTRIVLVTALVALVTAGVLVLGVAIALTQATSTEERGRLVDRATAVAATVRVSDGRPRVLDAPESGEGDTLDQNLWIYDRTGRLLDGTPPPARLRGTVRRLTRQTMRTSRAGAGERTVVVADSFRLLARPVRDHGRVVAAIVAGADLAPYRSFQQRGVWTAVGLGLLAVLASAAAAYAGTGYSLRQVRDMARKADQWQEDEGTGRFALGPPRDEIGELSRTLDRMLDRIDEVIRAERRLTDEVAHELRTPLTVLRSEAQILQLAPDLDADVREGLAAIDVAAQRIDSSIGTILAAARAHTRDDTCTTADVAERLRAAEPGLRVEAPSPALTLSAPLDVVEAILRPLLDNAHRHARSTVSVSMTGHEGRVRLAVSDDGPGVAGEATERVFRPGETGRKGGSGLGLPLVRRLVRAVGGTAYAEDVGHGRFVVELPAHQHG